MDGSGLMDILSGREHMDRPNRQSLLGFSFSLPINRNFSDLRSSQYGKKLIR
jgi:hypothetical protein